MKADSEKLDMTNRGFLVLEWVIGLAVIAGAAVAISTLLLSTAKISEQQREQLFDRELQQQNMRLERQLLQHKQFLQQHEA